MNDKPSRADRFRPAELLGLAFAVALFAGVVVLITARDLGLAVIFLGIAFIVTLVVLAMLALVARPEEPRGSSGDGQGTRPGGQR